MTHIHMEMNYFFPFLFSSTVFFQGGGGHLYIFANSSTSYRNQIAALF